jgi:hypothetical protein
MRQTRIELIDDRDGSAADETVRFGLDGVNYEIDLNDKHASEFRNLLLPYTSAARKVGRGGVPQVRVANGGARPTRATADRQRLSAIREWGKANGYTISDRGRIPQDVVDAFDAASSAPTPSAADPEPKAAPTRRSRRGKPTAAAPEFTQAG